MEIKKEDFVKFRIVDTFFVAFKPSILDEMPEGIPIKVIETIEKEVEPTEEELEAIAKAKEIEELKAKLASLEE